MAEHYHPIVFLKDGNGNEYSSTPFQERAGCVILKAKKSKGIQVEMFNAYESQTRSHVRQRPPP